MKRYSYLGALAAIFALALFAGTAIADDSTPATDTATPVAAAEPGVNDGEGTQSDAVGADAVAAAESEPTASTTEEPGTADETPSATDTPAAGSENTTTSNEHGTTSTEHGTVTSETPVTCREGALIGPTFTIGASSATATFSIRAGCEGASLTLASYSMPQAVVSFPQTLFASSTGVFSAGGPYTLTVAVPACFFQVDLFHGGGAPDSLGAINAGPGGVAGYAWSSPNKVCETTPPGETVPTPGGSTTPVNTVTTETTTTTTTTTTPTTTTTTPTTTTGGTAPTTQEVAGESTGGNNDVLGTVAAAAHLPFTGVSLLLVTVAGILLALLGFALRGIARRGNAR